MTSTENVQVYRSMGYGEWEDDVKSVFHTSWKEDRGKVWGVLREMFEEHEDVHELVLFFLRHMGNKGRSKTHALNRALLLEFLKWKTERAGKLPKSVLSICVFSCMSVLSFTVDSS